MAKMSKERVHHANRTGQWNGSIGTKSETSDKKEMKKTVRDSRWTPEQRPQAAKDD